MKMMWVGVCAVVLAVSMGCGSTRNAAPQDQARSIRTSCDHVVLPDDIKGDEVGARIVADLRSGEHLDLTTMGQEEFDKVIRKYGHLSVGSRVTIGNQELVCEIEEITNYRELKHMQKNLKDYEKEVRKFIASDKEQLRMK